MNAQAEQTWGQARIAAQSTLDSIKDALDQLSRTSGRHMLLLSSSGFLSGTLDQQLDAIISEAVRAGVVIDSLDAKGLYAEAPGTPLNESVEVVELPLGSHHIPDPISRRPSRQRGFRHGPLRRKHWRPSLPQQQ